MLKGVIGGNEAAAFYRRFDDRDARRQAAYDPVSPREIEIFWLRSQCKLRHEGAAFCDPLGQFKVFAGIAHVDSAAQHRNGFAAIFQTGFMGDRVDPMGEAADDDQVFSDQALDSRHRYVLAILGKPAGPDNGNGVFFKNVR